MALRDQPYLPLYVQDLLTDEKLIECSAAAHGVYLRLLCLLHKQDKYGLLCLKQKYKQNPSKLQNFASMLVKQMPFAEQTIQDGLSELSTEGVITITDDTLFQKRMLKDGEVSMVRSEAGRDGGKSVTKQYGKSGYLYWFTDYQNENKIGISTNPQNRLYRIRCDLKMKKFFIEQTLAVEDMGAAEDIALDFFKDEREGEWLKIHYDDVKTKFALLEAKLQANVQPNAENEYENEIIKQILKSIREIESVEILAGEENLYTMIVLKMMDVFKKHNPSYFFDKETDYKACLQIAYNIAAMKDWKRATVLNGNMQPCLQEWETIVEFIKTDKWFSSRSLTDISTVKEWQRINQSIHNSKKQNNATNKHVVGKTLDRDRP